jgi:hypothetical protein
MAKNWSLSERNNSNTEYAMLLQSLMILALATGFAEDDKSALIVGA